MKISKPFVFVFLIANFLALALGVLLMNDGPQTPWYLALNKAPWTPVNWVFGTAWTTIMLCFSLYMTKLSMSFKTFNKQLCVLFTIQWLLNVGWNYAFFNQHQTKIGLIIITLLWLLVGYFTFKYLKKVKYATILILPYLVWMTIATSLNAYIVFNN